MVKGAAFSAYVVLTGEPTQLGHGVAEGGLLLLSEAAQSSGANLWPDSPSFLESAADRLRSRCCCGGYRVRCRYGRLW